MELSDTQPDTGWGILCCSCKHVWDDDRKHLPWPPNYPCDALVYRRERHVDNGTARILPIFVLQRWEDESETCPQFKENRCFGDEVMAVPMKRWIILRHMRYIYLKWKFNRWWKKEGHLLGAFPNSNDSDYLQEVWDGKA